jgi:CheY-like chemotaxis protein
MRRILLVEDEDILRESYDMVLSTQPYIVDTAANGQEALEKYRENHYDLILLDIMMPIMDGVAFLEVITKEATELPKVLMLTNLSSGSEIDRALKLGAEKTMLKSDLSPKQLIAAVRYEVEAVGI